MAMPGIPYGGAFSQGPQYQPGPPQGPPPFDPRIINDITNELGVLRQVVNDLNQKIGILARDIQQIRASGEGGPLFSRDEARAIALFQENLIDKRKVLSFFPDIVRVSTLPGD
jgi:hypothetical protein